MKRTLATGAAISFILLGAACANDAEEQVAEAPNVEAPTLGDPAAVPAQTGTALKVDTLAGAGPYLTDEQGRALYLLEGVPQGQCTSFAAHRCPACRHATFALTVPLPEFTVSML